jgi:hypothetical protein
LGRTDPGLTPGSRRAVRRLLAPDRSASVAPVAVDDLQHQLFDLGPCALSERLGGGEVLDEGVTDRGAGLLRFGAAVITPGSSTS